MSVRPADCATVADELPELALGTLSGARRAVVLSHVQGCARCIDEVDRLASAADAILAVAPDAEPPAGFETVVLERMGLSGRRRLRVAPRRRITRIALAAGALAGALGTGLGLGLSSAGGGGPAAVAPIAADLTAHHAILGEVYLAAGSPGWLFMSVDHLGVTGLVTCKVRTVGGATSTVGTFWVEGGAGSWAYQLPVPAGQVRAAWVLSGGAVLASAQLNR